MLINLEKVYAEIAKEIGVDKQLVKDVINHKHRWLRTQLERVDNIHIHDQFWGTYKIMPGVVASFLNKYPNDYILNNIKKNYDENNER